MNRLKELTITKEGFAFDPGTGESYRLTESAQKIMEWMKEDANIRNIAEKLSSCYSLSPESALEDVQELQLQLKLQGLIE